MYRGASRMAAMIKPVAPAHLYSQRLCTTAAAATENNNEVRPASATQTLPNVAGNAAAGVAASFVAKAPVTALTLDPATVDPHRLMLVATQYLSDPRRSRPAAQRLLETIQARIDDLPVVFLATIIASNWPAGMITDTLRVAVRRRVAKGVLDLNGDDVARVFVAWARPPEQANDVALFKRLGKLIAFHINDIREPALVVDLLSAIARSGLKPPPGFMSLLARRAVALDRRQPLHVQGALGLISLLDKQGALDHATATALINRIVTTVRAELESFSSTAAANLTSDETSAKRAASTTEAAGGATEASTIAKVAGVSVELVDAVQREDASLTEPAGTTPSAVDEPRDTRWPLTGPPMAHVTLTATQASAIMKKLHLSRRRIFALLSLMQENKLTSPLYSRPLVALVLPGIVSMHPLDALHFVRDGGMRRVVSQKLTSAIAERLRVLELDFVTRVQILKGLVGYRRHVAAHRNELKASEAPGGGAGGEATKAAAAAGWDEEPEDTQLTERIALEVLAHLEGIKKQGMPVTPLLSALRGICELSETGMPLLGQRLQKTLPLVVDRFRHLVLETGTVSVAQCDSFLSIMARCRYEDSTGAIEEIKAARQQAENEGRLQFECKLQVSKFIFKEISRLNQKLSKGEKLQNAQYDELFRLALGRHPMSVLEAMFSFEHAFPRTMYPSLKRELGKALVLRLAPPGDGHGTGAHRPVPLTPEEWPRFVELIRCIGPESVVTTPSVWKFVLHHNKLLGGNPEIQKYAEEMLTIFDRRR